MKNISCLIKISLLVLFLIASGCSMKYTPQLYPIRPGTVPDFTSTETVDIINAVQDSDVMNIGTAGAAIYKSSLSEICDAIIEVLRGEAVKKGVNFEVGAEKKMAVSVLNTHVYKKPFGPTRCKIIVQVKTGSGYSKVFQMDNGSAIGPRACDGAVTWIATDILNDEKIIQYLSK